MLNMVYMLAVTFGNNKGKSFELKEGENLVGRCDPDSDEKLAIDLDQEDLEAKVSRQHAVVLVNENSVTVEDLGSLNGTFLMCADGAQKLEPGKGYTLSEGGEIVFGKVSLKLLSANE